MTANGAHAARAGLLRRLLGWRKRELVASQARYASLLAQLPDVIVVLGPDGTVEECSASLERVFGHRPEQVIGRSFFDLDLVPGLSHESRGLLLDHILSEQSPSLPAARVRHVDGSLRHVEASGRVVEAEDGKVRLHLVVRDVTARVEAEEAQAGLQRQLEETRRLEALGRLAGGVAHDFNNLLLVISANTEILRRGTGDVHAALDQIGDAQEAAAELIRQLLAFSRQAPDTAEVIDVRVTVERIEGLLRRLVPPGVEVEVSRTDETTIRVSIPDDGPEATARAELDRTELDRTELAGIRILLVDDEPAVRETLARGLEDFGALVVSAGDPATAIELGNRHGDGIDVLVTDVRMPGMSGADLAHELRGDRPGLPVLFISGYAAEIVDHDDGPALPTAVLSKPFGLEELTGAIAELVSARVEDRAQGFSPARPRS